MTDLIDTVQLQEIDDAYVELFDVTLQARVRCTYLMDWTMEVLIVIFQ